MGKGSMGGHVGMWEHNQHKDDMLMWVCGGGDGVGMGPLRWAGAQGGEEGAEVSDLRRSSYDSHLLRASIGVT